MIKVIVTGATGLIGLALIKECIRHGWKVYAVVRPKSLRKNVLPKNSLLNLIECDLKDLKNLKNIISEKCDVFYHLGWGHTGAAKNLDIKYQIENINFTIDAVRVANELGCQLFVGAGSQAEYGNLDIDKISPECPTNPKIAYGICKLSAGKLAEIECNKLGINFVWIRIFSTYGVNDKKDMLMGSLIQKMLVGEHISMTKGIQQWDYLYCDDAGRAFYLVGEKCKFNAVYCLGSGIKKPLKEFVEIVAEKIGYNREIGFGEIPYNDSSVMNLCADISTLTRDTGFIPEIPFEEGIERYICYIKDNEIYRCS